MKYFNKGTFLRSFLSILGFLFCDKHKTSASCFSPSPCFDCMIFEADVEGYSFKKEPWTKNFTPPEQMEQK